MSIIEPAAEFFCIIADGIFDQITQGKANAQREAKDLRAMGCKVTVKGPMTAADADALEEKHNG